MAGRLGHVPGTLSPGGLGNASTGAAHWTEVWQICGMRVLCSLNFAYFRLCSLKKNRLLLLTLGSDSGHIPAWNVMYYFLAAYGMAFLFNEWPYAALFLGLALPL